MGPKPNQNTSRLAVTNALCFLRSLRRRRVRAYLIILSIALTYLLFILPISLWRSHRAQVTAYDMSIANLPKPRVFIAAMLANCAPLLSQHWIPSLLRLVDLVGTENVFVSIVENGSVDETRLLLEGLERNLTDRGVGNTFRYEEDFRDGVTFQKEGLLTRLLGKEGTRDNWILTDKGWFPRRISYLAALRNMVIQPLHESTRQFDKILFINDVIFSAEDALRLLQTNHGHYSAACGLDYFRPHLFYDTFAMRDVDGHPMIAILFPFFPAGSTRDQLLSQNPTIQVKSCWNGMVALNAAPFQNRTDPLRFRAIHSSLSLQEGYLEGSEACLIHADMSHLQETSNLKTYVNSLVRVSYNLSAYTARNSIFQMFLERVVGRVVAAAYDLRNWWVQCRLAAHAAERREKIREWERDTGLEEVGAFCLNDQMQLLTPWGWAHV